VNVLDLFSGIGGFSLGLERAGMRTVAFCEIDPYACAVLAKHWPSVPIYRDVQAITAIRITDDGISVDVICGGFPCQDISFAGAGAGLEGARSGLWREFARLIGELRPKFALVENVAALTVRGLLNVLGDLATLGYDAEWHCIPACYVGAWHERDRIWILAYPQSNSAGEPKGPLLRQRHLSVELGGGFAEWPGRSNLPESRFCRTTNGFPRWMDRSRCLGNAVVPQIPEAIGRAIMNAEGNSTKEKK
jgi:DNA (cytosine-5)-methyltransferase 1